MQRPYLFVLKKMEDKVEACVSMKGGGASSYLVWDCWVGSTSNGCSDDNGRTGSCLAITSSVRAGTGEFL